MTFIELAAELDAATEELNILAEQVNLAQAHLDALKANHNAAAGRLKELYAQMQTKMGTLKPNNDNNLKQLFLDGQKIAKSK